MIDGESVGSWVGWIIGWIIDWILALDGAHKKYLCQWHIEELVSDLAGDINFCGDDEQTLQGSGGNISAGQSYHVTDMHHPGPWV